MRPCGQVHRSLHIAVPADISWLKLAMPAGVGGMQVRRGNQIALLQARNILLAPSGVLLLIIVLASAALAWYTVHPL